MGPPWRKCAEQFYSEPERRSLLTGLVKDSSTKFSVFVKNFDGKLWRVSDCEELVGGPAQKKETMS